MPGLTIASAPITGSRFIGSIRYVRAFRISTLPMWRNRGMLVDLSIELVLECLGHAIEDRCPSGVGFEDRFPNLFGFLPGQGEGDRHQVDTLVQPKPPERIPVRPWYSPSG